MSRYVLENKKEFDRLERQSNQIHYDFKKEIGELPVMPGAKILDAGCGSGIVSRYLAEKYPSAEISGCDLSQQRIEAAEKAAAQIPNLRFVAGDLTHIPFPAKSFDFVICRYVLQHLGQDEKNQAVLREFLRVLKPGGEVRIVDVDGLLANLYPQPIEIQETVTRLREEGPVDLHIGRKLPSLMLKAGFENLDWEINTSDFKGEEMDTEVSLMRERFELVRPFFSQFLGGESQAQDFITGYLSAMKAPGAVYFQNMFTICGHKSDKLSKNSLKLIK